MSDQASAMSVNVARTLDEGGWNAFQKAVLVFAALAFCVDGLANQTLALAVPQIMGDWGLSRGDFANVQAVGLFGVLIGNALGGVIGDRFGRRTGMIGTMLLFGAATAACSMTQDLGQLMMLRALAGLGIGGMIPSGAAMIAEFTPLRRRSWAIAIGMVFIPVGSVLAGLIAAYVLPRFGWRALFLADGGLPLISALLFLFVLPESPRFLARRPERKAQLVSLLGRLGHRFAADAEFVDEEASKKAPLTALLGSEMRLDTLLLWAGFFFVLLANYMVLSWAPTLVSEQGYAPVVTSTTISAFSFGGIAGGVVCGWGLEKFGSRATTLVIALGALAGGVALALYPFDPTARVEPLFAVVAFEGFFLAALHTVMYAMAAQVYPSFVRATGVGSAAAFGRIGAVASSYVGTMALGAGGPNGFFIVMGVSTLVAVAAMVSIRRQIVKVG